MQIEKAKMPLTGDTAPIEFTAGVGIQLPNDINKYLKFTVVVFTDYLDASDELKVKLRTEIWEGGGCDTVFAETKAVGTGKNFVFFEFDFSSLVFYAPPAGRDFPERLYLELSYETSETAGGHVYASGLKIIEEEEEE